MIRILIELRPLMMNHVSEETKQFIINGLRRLAAGSLENSWYVLSDRPGTGGLGFPIPEDHWIIKKSYPGHWGWKYWYDWQIPQLIKKKQVDLLITTGGTLSSTGIPQCVWMPGSHPIYNGVKKTSVFSVFCKKRLKKTMQNAAAIFVFSENDKEEHDLSEGLSGGKIIVVPCFAEEDYLPLSWAEKENIKIKFAGGKEYFLVTGEPGFQECIRLLKAFSRFKKMQQSNMQMLFAVKYLNRDQQFSEKLTSYKYRKDILVYDPLSPGDRKDMLSGAYAIYCAASENEALSSLLNASRAGVPVITSDTVYARKTFTDGALYTDGSSEDSLSALFISLYKDEILRVNLIENGKIRASQFSREQSDAQIRKGISAAINK